MPLSGFFKFSRCAVSSNEGEPRFSLPVRVYYDDTDVGGTVYYANFLRFMERARTEWLRSLDFELDALRLREGLLFVVRHAEIAYLRPAVFNDLLTVTVDLRAGGKASMDFVQEIRRTADTTLCCRGRIKVACIDEKTLRPTRLPERLLAEIVDVC